MRHNISRVAIMQPNNKEDIQPPESEEQDLSISEVEKAPIEKQYNNSPIMRNYFLGLKNYSIFRIGG